MADLSDSDKKAVEPIIAYFDGNFERFITDESLITGDCDLAAMKEIVSLAKSQNFQDRLKSLDLISSATNKFPFGFEENLLIALKKDSNQQVRERANIVDQQRRVRTFNTIGKGIASLINYGDAFKTSSVIINATSTAFSQSQAIAKSLPAMMAQPIRLIDPKMFDGLLKSMKILPPMPAFSVFNASTSPITTLQPIIQPILIRSHPELTLSEALGKPPDLIISDLKKISSTNKEIVFNYEGYTLLYDLERFLRDLIHQRICIPFIKMIQNKIHPEILKKWRERRDEEDQNPLMKNGYRLIDYSDFSDLKDILLKGRNRDEFKDLLNDEEMRNLISKLDELDPIRKKIAHSRPLSTDDFARLRLYANDIARLFDQNESDSQRGIS
jgi:hypothetical protein